MVEHTAAIAAVEYVHMFMGNRTLDFTRPQFRASSPAKLGSVRMSIWSRLLELPLGRPGHREILISRFFAD
jgi:hypothetical protein